jgi:hypothetical protein
METPTITASAYTSTNVDAAKWLHQLQHQPAGRNAGTADALKQFQPQPLAYKEPAIVSTARIVKVFIADSNDNLPLDKRVLHSGAEQLTDLTDQELFFEVPIAEILAKHNEVRKATVDKKQAEKFGRDIYLEPARIRDLKMVVVNVAQF